MGETKNMQLWESVCKTDPAMLKNAKVGGRTITAIDPQYQRQLATEKFGPFGFGWGVKNVNKDIVDFENGTKMMYYSATMWFMWEGVPCEFPIESAVKLAYMTRGQSPYLSVDDEATKKVATNALTKGLSTLGFNADVFLGKFDDSVYAGMQNDLAAIEAERTAIGPENINLVNELLEQSGADVDKFLEYIKVDAVASIKKRDLPKVINSLKAKILAKGAK